MFYKWRLFLCNLIEIDTTLEVAVPKVEFLDCYVVGYDVLWKIRVLHLDQ
jgi:hypothetical protein